MASQVNSINAQVSSQRGNSVSVLAQRVCQADGAINVVVALGLLLEAPMIASWFGLSTLAVQIVTVVWLLVGADLIYVARAKPSSRQVQAYAAINFAWVVGSAIVLALAWNNIANEGRWLVALLADMALALGIVQAFALRQTR